MWKSHIYTAFVHDRTNLCYGKALETFRAGARVLDVGIGNGAMIRRFHEEIRNKNLFIEGIDINDEYLAACRDLIDAFDLQAHVSVANASVHSYEPTAGTQFDWVFFSMSYPLLSERISALRRAKQMLASHGCLMFVHTQYRQRSRMMEFLNPRLKYFTTIEFGDVLYRQTFGHELANAGFRIVRDETLKPALLGAEYQLTVARPEPSA